jgi:hypothetical protein
MVVQEHNMTTRITQLIGRTTGCEIAVIWNETPVWHGTVSQDQSVDDTVHQVLAEWTTESSIFGSIPLSVQCLSGSLHVINVYMNHVYPIQEHEISDQFAQAVWPVRTPTAGEFIEDVRTLPRDQLEHKYGLSWTALRDRFIVVETVPAAEHMTQPVYDLDVVETDGKDNVKIDNVAFDRHNVDQYYGSWHWLVLTGQTLTCTIRVEPIPS